MKRTANYRMGALKRKFNNGPEDREPGTFISKVNENKTPRLLNTNSPLSLKQVAIRGMV